MSRLLSTTCCFALLALPGLAMGSPLPVSPASPEGIAAAASSCPAFSWTALDGARGYQLVVYRVEGEAVMEESLPRGASSWTPSAERCLEPGGTYAWVVRAVDEQAVGEWSAASLFTVPARPGPDELEAALEVVRRYLAGEPEPGDSSGVAPGTARRPAPRPAASGEPGTAPAALTAGAAAIRGELTATTGVTYGAIGVSNSLEGAGLAAVNTAGGADLVFDGPVATLATESGIDRPDAGAQSFSIQNSGGGGMTLFVDGSAVLTEATGGDITAVTAGDGLTGGGTSGDVALAADFSGSGAADTVARSDHHHFSQSWIGEDTVAGLRVSNLYTDVYTNSTGVWGAATNPGGSGVFGSGPLRGIWGQTSSDTGTGVFGQANGTSGTGVSGFVLASSGNTTGVRGNTASSAGVGGYFTNSGGGDLLAAGDSGSSTDRDFRVDNSGNVFAPSFAGNGSGLTYSCGIYAAAASCPADVDGSPCDLVPRGSWCEGDGECGTSESLDNCPGGWDWYIRTH